MINTADTAKPHAHLVLSRLGRSIKNAKTFPPKADLNMAYVVCGKLNHLIAVGFSRVYHPSTFLREHSFFQSPPLDVGTDLNWPRSGWLCLDCWAMFGQNAIYAILPHRLRAKVQEYRCVAECLPQVFERGIPTRASIHLWADS